MILAVVVAVIVAGPFLVGGGLVIAAVLVPLAALAITGVLVWWLVAGEGPSGEPRDIALRAALGVGVLIVSVAVAIGGAIAAAAGGETVVAVLLIVAGLAIVGGAFVRPVRWLILPAVLLGLSAGSVAAADVTLDGGVGDRQYRPTSMAELRDHYQLGAGQLDIDLRDLDLPRGDTPLEIDMGAGEVRLAVPASVCVATDAEVGVGEARVLGRANSGVDVNLVERPDAPAAASRLLVDAQIGVGHSRSATPTIRHSTPTGSTSASTEASIPSSATRTPTPPARRRPSRCARPTCHRSWPGWRSGPRRASAPGRRGLAGPQLRPLRARGLRRDGSDPAGRGPESPRLIRAGMIEAR